MFCYQCEQAAGGTGCTKVGVCGKDQDIQSLQDILEFGVKGIAAYAYHARQYGKRDEQVDAFMHEAMFSTLTNVNFDLNRYVGLVLKAGEMNLRVMELLNDANTERFGNPTPVTAGRGTKAGPGIVMTGHDLIDLHELLKQTEGKGINCRAFVEIYNPTLEKLQDKLVKEHGYIQEKHRLEIFGLCPKCAAKGVREKTLV